MALTGDKETEDGNGKTTSMQNSYENTKNESDDTNEQDSKKEKETKVNNSIATPTKETKENDLPDVTTFEDILAIVGTRGRWTLMLFLLRCCTSFLAAWQTMSYQFLGATPDHWCHIEPLLQAGWTQDQIINFAIPMDKEGKREGCLMYDYNYTMVAEVGYEGATASFLDTPALVPCYSRDFNHSQYQSTVTTEWDLVCERRALYSTTQAAAQLGKLIGYFFVGYLTDMFGRRRIAVIGATMAILTSFGCAVAPNVELYIILRIGVNIATSGAFLGAFVLLLESTATRDRAKVAILGGMAWSLGYMTLPAVAYFIRTWKWLQAALSLPSLLLITYYWLLPESPRWLIMQGRLDEALKVIKGAAKLNRKTLPPDSSLLAAMQRLHTKFHQQASTDHEAAVVGEKTTEESRCERAGGCVVSVIKRYLTVLTTNELRPRALIVFFCWFAVSNVYYGISLNATNISVNVYLYLFIGGALEVAERFVLLPLITYLGRVKALTVLYLVCGLAILILALFIFFYPDAPRGLLMFFSLAGKMAISSCFSIIWMFTPELFPTKYRSMATGQASVCARLGSISSPYINDLLGELVVWAPSAVFCTMSFVAAGLAFFLPETKGRCMPEGCTIEDKPDRKGKVNQAYLPETESQFTEIPITPRNSEPDRLSTDKDTMEVTDTKM